MEGLTWEFYFRTFRAVIIRGSLYRRNEYAPWQSARYVPLITLRTPIPVCIASLTCKWKRQTPSRALFWEHAVWLTNNAFTCFRERTWPPQGTTLGTENCAVGLGFPSTAAPRSRRVAGTHSATDMLSHLLRRWQRSLPGSVATLGFLHYEVLFEKRLCSQNVWASQQQETSPLSRWDRSIQSPCAVRRP